MSTSSSVADILADKAKQSSRQGIYSLSSAMPVAEAVGMMADNAISSVLVIDEGAMVGIVTMKEILHALHARDGSLAGARCGEIMKPNPPVTDPADTVDHLRSLMTELHITHVPVMKDGALIGIVSFHDIARSALKDADFENRLLKQYIKNWPE
jgi:CBS domain-containing protein